MREKRSLSECIRGWRYPQWCAIQDVIYFINPARSLRPQQSALSHVPLTSLSISMALAPSDPRIHFSSSATQTRGALSNTIACYLVRSLLLIALHTHTRSIFTSNPITSVHPRGLPALMNPLLPCKISGLPEKSPSLIKCEFLLLAMSAQG